MASIGYDLAKDVNLYATFAQGWKAGGLNRFPSRQNAVQPYNAEKSNNWEIGLKSSLLHHHLSLNVAAFWITINGQQLANVVPDPNGLTPITVIENAGKSRSRRGDHQYLELDIRRVDAGVASGGFSAPRG